MLPLSIEKLSPKGRHPKNCIRKHPTRFITVKPSTIYQLDENALEDNISSTPQVTWNYRNVPFQINWDWHHNWPKKEKHRKLHAPYRKPKDDERGLNALAGVNL